MFISKVSIRNFRNFKNATFNFVKGVNTIIGENGSGKTNFFRAIRLILDDYLYRQSYKLNEKDFNRSIGNWRGHWIIISIEFQELSPDEVIQSLFIHSSGKVEEFDSLQTASYTLIFKPQGNILTDLSEIAAGEVEELDEYLSTISLEDYETIFTGRSTADFSNDDVYKEIVGDFESVIFPSETDYSLIGVKVPNQLSITREVSCTFIQALRDVVSEFHANKTNPLLTLMKKISDEIDPATVEPIIESVKDLNSQIEGLQQVKKVREDISKTMLATVGATYAPESMSIKSNVPEDPEKMLQSLRLLIGEDADGYEGGISELSLGGANLIFLTLKLLEYQYRKSHGTLANFLLIEEPEAHIHNHIQKTLFEKVSFEDTQIIYSTHSTQISEVSKISAMNVLSRKSSFVEVYHPSNNLSKGEIVKVERYLDAVRTNILFAKGVILVEGDAEEILIPQLVKSAFGLSIDELGISIVNIRGVGFENLAKIFETSRIRKHCAILTDLDEGLDGIETKASLLGVGRRDKLNDIFGENDFVELFLAKNTFEIDLALSNNLPIFKKLVPVVYSQDATIAASLAEIDSGVPQTIGERIIKMASYQGKGWFALEMLNFIDGSVDCPEYILNAVVFAMSDNIKLNAPTIIESRLLAWLKGEVGRVIPEGVSAEMKSYNSGESTIEDLVNLKELLGDDQVYKALTS